ncbi:MAG: hypothetical protein JKY56_25490 [Kofleriaceae bacterium]|nr:hypothetical protein [Kofleriaceae bacterium]
MRNRLLLTLLSVGALSSLTLPLADADDEPIPASPDIRQPAIPDHLSIEVPSSFSPLPGLSKAVATTAGQTNYFDAELATGGAVAFGRANRGALYLTWVRSDRVIVEAEKVLRIALDNLHRAPFDANSPNTIEEKYYRESVHGGLSEMRWEWLHQANETINVVRVLAWKDSDSHIHLAIAECIFAQKGDDTFRDECQETLDSLALGESASISNLSALAAPIVAPTAIPEDFAVPKLKTGNLEVPSNLSAPPSQMGDVLYRGKPKPSSEDPNNRIFIGIGICLLGLAIYLTTRSNPNEKKSWSKDDPKDDPEEGGAEADDDADSAEDNKDKKA